MMPTIFRLKVRMFGGTQVGVKGQSVVWMNTEQLAFTGTYEIVRIEFEFAGRSDKSVRTKCAGSHKFLVMNVRIALMTCSVYRKDSKINTQKGPNQKVRESTSELIL